VVYHDPRQEILKLREQLAAQDKPIAFLIGAGVSSAVKDSAGEPLVPQLRRLTDICFDAVRALGKPFADGLDQTVSDATSSLGRTANIEDVLSIIRLQARAVGPRDALGGLDRSQIEMVEGVMRKTIASASRPEDARIPERLPHRSLARWIGRVTRTTPVEVFTTNYDTLIERGLEAERVPVFDGFVGSREPFFLPGSLTWASEGPGRSWARLWKVHGSVNWAWREAGDGSRRIVRGPENEDGELILPSLYKYDESRRQPYVAMIERMSRLLTNLDHAVLLSLGYSFGDQHINATIFDALEIRPRSHLVAFMHSDPDPTSDIAKRAGASANIIAYGPTKAIVGGLVGEWRLREPVDSGSASLLDIPFDSDAQVDPHTPSLTGKWRLGDFEWFAKFLDTIVSA
jgi:hypothetical protein